MTDERPTCENCGDELTAAEVAFYGEFCNACESDWSVRVDLWRAGADDPELDEHFAQPPDTEH